MSTIGTVLCPVDFSPLSERSLRLAVEICRRTDARLVLEHNLECCPPASLGVGWMWSEEQKRSGGEDPGKLAVRRLQKMFEKIPAGIEYEAKITRGPLDESLLHLARILSAGMIVMGTHGPSSAEHRSVTEKIIIQAPCTVLSTGESYRPESVFGAGEQPENLSMLAPCDFSSRAKASLEVTFSMARHMPHQVHLLHVIPGSQSLPAEPVSAVDLDGPRARLAALVPEDLVGRTEIDVVVGDPVSRILERARATNALFIMMPAHGKGPLKRFLFGTTTLEVLHGASCPVWFMSAAARRNPPEWAAA